MSRPPVPSASLLLVLLSLTGCSGRVGPEMLLLIDVGGDGTCSPADVFAEGVRYAWGSFPGADGYEHSQFEGQSFRSVAAGGAFRSTDVCSLFGPSSRPDRGSRPLVHGPRGGVEGW